MKSAASLQIDLESATPVGRQIVDGLRTLLVEQALRPGDDLPSLRRLALDLGVHFNTVAEAYRTLAEEGWLEVTHGRAARVRERRAPRADEQQASGFRKRLRELVAEMRSAGMPTSKVIEELRVVMEGLGL